MKNIELFKTMLKHCNELTTIKDELNNIDIPDSQRDLSLSKVNQLLTINPTQKWLQENVRTLLSNLSSLTKCIDAEYLKHLDSKDGTARIILNHVINYNPKDGIGNDCFVFEQCIPFIKDFLLSEIYLYEYLEKESSMKVEVKSCP